jgi:hypothetical protein
MNTAKALILCTLAAVGACNRDTESPQPAPGAPRVNVPVAAKKGPGAEELTAGMVEAANQGISQLPVKLKFDLRERPAIGQPLDIDVAVLPQIDAISGHVVVAGGDGLTVAPGANQLELPAIEAGQVYRQGIKVTPTVDGVLLLSLTVSLKHDDQTDSRTFSIPLIVER